VTKVGKRKGISSMNLKASLASFLAALSLSAPVLACEQWEVAGTFKLHQSNRLTVTGAFQQDGGTLTGDARFFSPTLGDDGTWLDGKITGTATGERIAFDISWYGDYVECNEIECVGSGYASGGRYEGQISQEGEVSGLAWEIRRPDDKVSWRLEGPARCTPKKVTRLGKKPPPKKPGVADTVREPGGVAPPDRSGAVVSDQAGLSDVRPRCKSDFVWREAKPDDYVCVPPASRSRVSKENAEAASRRDPDGAYGPNTCINGYVWREAFDGDVVCVTPEVRALVKEENRLGPSRTE